MMFDKGSGSPVVVVQPLQGRWQWMRRFLDALSSRCRVISYTLAGDFGADRRLDPSQGFDQYVRQLEDVIQRAGIERTALCGISFGGVVALRYAARHPARVTHLVIASSPGPNWQPSHEQDRYVSRPVLTLPVFLWHALGRLSRELAASFPQLLDRLAFVVRAAATALRYPALPHVMAKRVRLMQTVDLAADCERIRAATLIITGAPELDHVVPVESTKRYLACIRDSRYAIMENTGHTGSLLQPQQLAQLVGDFIHASHP
jgi:pimeloyl-ACP methyl ester carboxylesterase